MPQAIVMPKLGNSVESAIILTWHVDVGDAVRAGQALCEIETDKATLEVESSATGILLARFFEAGAEVPVLRDIAIVGSEGEPFELPAQAAAAHAAPPPQASTSNKRAGADRPKERLRISPRARNLAQRKSIDTGDIAGTGPAGRVIERDIRAALDQQPKVSPLAQAMLASGDYQIADELTDVKTDERGKAKRLTKSDLKPAAPDASSLASEEVKTIALTGARRTIARRMLESLQSTAQLTLNASAEATVLRGLRARLKASDEALFLRGVTINDLLMFAVARTLPAFPELNALYENDSISQYKRVHLGMAVHTPRALLVPVIRAADSLSLRALSAEAKRLARACKSGKIKPDDMTGGSFTVTNLGSLGIESFTPILNPPQVGILGVGSVQLKPVERDGAVVFLPHIGLSLTVNHQAVDGAPAARFLAQLRENIAHIDLLLAV